MFRYATASDLKALVDAQAPGARLDDWFDGWVEATMLKLIAERRPRTVLDIMIGERDRAYAAHLGTANLAQAHIGSLPASSDKFDLVMALSYDRAAALSPVDPDRPYAEAELLLDAAERVAPGGALAWSHAYAFAEDGAVHALLEPAALYRALVLRGLQPLDGHPPASKLDIYRNPDTLFVHHKAVLAMAPRHHRIARIFCCLARPDPAAAGRGWLGRWLTRHRAG